LVVKDAPSESDRLLRPSRINSDEIYKLIRQEDAVSESYRQNNVDQPVVAVSLARVVEHAQARDVGFGDLI
jgi:hypothetical protein